MLYLVSTGLALGFFVLSSSLVFVAEASLDHDSQIRLLFIHFLFCFWFLSGIIREHLMWRAEIKSIPTRLLQSIHYDATNVIGFRGGDSLNRVLRSNARIEKKEACVRRVMAIKQEINRRHNGVDVTDLRDFLNMHSSMIQDHYNRNSLT